MRRLLLISAMTVLALAMETGVAQAKRAPTTKERTRIASAVRAKFSAAPAGCIAVHTTVSTVNGAYASATVTFGVAPACQAVAANGSFLLKRTKLGFWKVIYNGSDIPSCVMPKPVFVDLFGSAACTN